MKIKKNRRTDSEERLYQFFKQKNPCNLTDVQIGMEFYRSASAVSRTIHELLKKGFIEVEKKIGQHKNPRTIRIKLDQ